MKNQILLSAMLLLGFTASATEVPLSASASAKTFSAKTIELVHAYFELGTLCADFVNGVTNDRAGLLKACVIAQELLKGEGIQHHSGGMQPVPARPPSEAPTATPICAAVANPTHPHSGRCRWAARRWRRGR